MNSDDLIITALLARPDALSKQAARRLRQLTVEAALIDDRRTVGPLTVYMGTRDPEVYGVPVHLRRRFLRFLQEVVRKPGYWASKNEIIEATWEPGDKPDTANQLIEHYAHHVRLALAKHLGFNPIETARGLGYRLNMEALRRSAEGKAA